MEGIEHDESKTLSVQSGNEVGFSILPEDALQTAIKEVFGTLGGKVLHNFQGDKVAIWRQTAIATGPDVKTIDDIPPEGIPVKHFYVHPVELDGKEDGEIVDAIRSVLITPEGVAYGFVSNFLARDLARMISVFGIGEWKPPIQIKVRSNKGKNGHKFYTIVPV
jgi:hypothetical protein